MNSICSLVLGILICLVLVNARQYGDRPMEEGLDLHEDNNQQHDNNVKEIRHRRKRRNGYSYNNRHYLPYDRRDDYDYNRQQDVLPDILRILEDISSHIKRSQSPPPPFGPPQPIYIPVYIPVPQYINCQVKRPNQNVPNKVNVSERFPAMEDPNQNWGYVEEQESPKQTGRDDDYDDDGARPISFTPIKPRRPLSRQQPKVEHGSTQAAEVTTRAPQVFGLQGPVSSTSHSLSVCDGAILSCCKRTDSREQQFKCFAATGCRHVYSNGAACRDESLAAVFDAISRAYAPIQ